MSRTLKGHKEMRGAKPYGCDQITTRESCIRRYGALTVRLREKSTTYQCAIPCLMVDMQ